LVLKESADLLKEFDKKHYKTVIDLKYLCQRVN